jgi:hypothetical protein
MLAAAVLATVPGNTTGAVNAKPNLDNSVTSHVVCANDQTPIPDGNDSDPARSHPVGRGGSYGPGGRIAGAPV